MRSLSYILGFFLISATSTQETLICSRCVFLSQCPPVVRILESYPYSMQSYFFASVSCGFIDFDTLVCCDMDVIQHALSAEATATDVHQDTFDDIIGFYREPYTTETPPSVFQPVKSSEDVLPSVVSQRLKGDSGNNTTKYRVNDAVCGSNTTFRIIGGEAAEAGIFPWMARLGYRVRGSVNSSAVNYRCGGALITARHVLTAAHCLVRLPQFTFLAVVKLGTDGTPTQSLAPERALPHPQYNTPRLQNDIGLVRLNRSIVFTEMIMPICLPFGEYAVDLTRLRPQSMLVAGWGTTSADSNSLSPTLQYTRLTYEPLSECSRVYATRFNLTIGPNQICTAGEKDRDSCGGDSGGPVFVWSGAEGSARAVGLVSFGARRCGTAGVPTVYTRLDAYQRWIEDNVAN